MSCGADGKVRVWDLASQQPIGIPHRGHLGHLGKVPGVAVGQIGGRAVVVSSGDNNKICVRDLESLQRIGGPLYGHEAQAIAMCSLAGRAYVAWACADGLRLWDPETETQRLLPRHFDRIRSVAMTAADGHVLAVSGDDTGSVQLWLVDQAEEGLQDGWDSDLVAHEARSIGWIQAVAAGGSGSSPIAVAAPHRGLLAWDLATGRPRHVPGYRDDPLAPVNALAVAEVDGQPIILAGHDDGLLSRWDPDRGRLPWPQQPSGGEITALATANVSGRPFAVAGAGNGDIRQWDLTSLQPVSTFPGGYRAVTCLTTGELDGQVLLIAGIGARSRHGTWPAKRPPGRPAPLDGAGLRLPGPSATSR